MPLRFLGFPFCFRRRGNRLPFLSRLLRARPGFRVYYRFWGLLEHLKELFMALYQLRHQIHFLLARVYEAVPDRKIEATLPACTCNLIQLGLDVNDSLVGPVGRCNVLERGV